jgi:hypothetical protein
VVGRDTGLLGGSACACPYLFCAAVWNCRLRHSYESAFAHACHGAHRQPEQARQNLAKVRASMQGICWWTPICVLKLQTLACQESSGICTRSLEGWGHISGWLQRSYLIPDTLRALMSTALGLCSGSVQRARYEHREQVLLRMFCSALKPRPDWQLQACVRPSAYRCHGIPALCELLCFGAVT